MSTRREKPTLGIVIPCYNEEAVVPLLLDELRAFAVKAPAEVKVLFVDDGSTDGTLRLLEEACRADARFACLGLSRNFGHQNAVTAGLARAAGDAVAVIDADLQDSPAVLLDMLAKWKEGFDVVYGIRTQRKEPLLLRLSYLFFYRLLRKVANVNLALDAGDFSLMDRRVVAEINRLPERNRFVRGLRSWVGFRQVGLPYERQSRRAGSSKYTVGRLFKLALDGLISFSWIPLRLAGWLGALSALMGFVYLLYALMMKLVRGHVPWGWTSTVVLILFVGGVQLIVLGIIGEYIGRIFDEVKSRPSFIVQRTAGWVGKAEGGSQV